LIVTAKKLAVASPKKPRQADLKRAISTAYYALFHALAKDAADLLIGTGSNRPNAAWTHLYRSLEHGVAKSGCIAVKNIDFPPAIKDCALAFVQLQEMRHDADYDPNLRVRRGDALEAIKLAESAIGNLRKSDRRDRLAFAVQILLRKRG
jgi:uncharacterized protein (UPF0332 family)